MDIMNKTAVDRVTIFVIAIAVFLVVYKGLKKSVEESFLWAAGVLLLLRLLIWRGMGVWMTPIYKITGVVEPFEDVPNKDSIELNMPLLPEQKEKLKAMMSGAQN